MSSEILSCGKSNIALTNQSKEMSTPLIMIGQLNATLLYRNRISERTLLGCLAAFRYSLPVLEIYSMRDINYRFSVLAVNIGTQPLFDVTIASFDSSTDTILLRVAYLIYNVKCAVHLLIR